MYWYVQLRMLLLAENVTDARERRSKQSVAAIEYRLIFV